MELTGPTDAVNFKADNLPMALGVMHVNTGIAVTSSHFAFRINALHLGQRVYQRGGTIEPDFAVGDIESREANAMGAHAGQRFAFVLQCSRR